MINTNNILYNIIKKCNSFDTSYVNEIEEVVDYGLEKTEENIQKVALEYLDEKGFARRPDNLNQAKQFVMESSEYSNTVCIRKRREIVEDLLEDASDEDLDRLIQASLLDKLQTIDAKLTKMTSPRYEYAVEVLPEVLTEADNMGASLTQFESFQTMLNRYASAGWHVKTITSREAVNHRISMTGFSSKTSQVVVVFERLK